MSDEKEPTASQQPTVANMYLETLVQKVDQNKYRLIRKLINTSHDLLEEEPDPLHESVDGILREAAEKLVIAKERGASAKTSTADGEADLKNS